MKLTASQIAQIEETLALNQVVFEDIKLELTDHIASDIEVVLSQEEIPFEEAMVIVFEKWSPQLRPSTSFWTPNNMKLPKIVLNKYKVEYKKQFIKGSLIAFFIAFSWAYLSKMIHDERVFEYLKLMLQIIFILEFILIFISKLVIWKSKTTTFNSFFFQKQTAIPLLLFILFLAMGLMPMQFVFPDFKIAIGHNFLIVCYFIWPLRPLKLAFQHFKYMLKLKQI
jgi:hypothetical protein